MIKQRNAEFCGSIPLNVINQIQDYGYLLIVHKESLQILQASENTSNVLVFPIEHLIESKLNDFLPEDQLSKIKEGIAKSFRTKLPMKLSFSVNEKTIYFDALIHFEGTCLVIELEKELSKDSDTAFIARFGEFKFIAAALTISSSIQELTDHVAEEIKKITTFDKVMVYKFDEEYNGTVVSEKMEQEMESYLGLCFPASDIPKQARDMYFQTTYRFIPDVNYVPSKLLPVINPMTNSFTDLTSCNMRGVAGVHLEYLKNMNVQASMSIRIVHENKLWGLIACHHRQPKKINYETCVLLEIISDFISSRLTILERESEHTRMNQLIELNTKILEQASLLQDDVSALLANENLMKVLNVDGAAVIKDKKLETIGSTPSPADIRDILRWAQKNKFDKVYSNSNFPFLYDRAKNFKNVCSGIIIVPLSITHDYYLMGFRKEILQQIKWGGNPDETIHFDSDGKKYHPRNSFLTWKETVNETSIPFQKVELNAANNLKLWLMEFILNIKNN
jgi:light-regulated signal transduction histidine kinase (bacteriophytochrome)